MFFFLKSRNDALLQEMNVILKQIKEFAPMLEGLSDQELKEKTNYFKERLTQGESLDDLLPEAYAVVAEASKRVLGLYHYDVQFIGGVALHQGKIAEMQTGEGKTIVAALPAYLNALQNGGVHVVTVNDYLVKRDASSIGKIHNSLGLSVGYIVDGQSVSDKKEAYKSDILYATASGVGFDYLRDNICIDVDNLLQTKGLHYAIIDEVDSVLIDEAGTPLVLSGPGQNVSIEYYKMFQELAVSLEQGQESGDFYLDEKTKRAYLTDIGFARIEKELTDTGFLKPGQSLYASENLSVVNYILSALRANYLFKKDKDYLVKDNEILLVSDKTGRVQKGRRWSEGLHQAIEAKEGVRIRPENVREASITIQNFFLLYKKISGMTGTAKTEELELEEIYNLEVVAIPTNIPSVRKDYNDVLYGSTQDKYEAIVQEIKDRQSKGQPILLGTSSIANSEIISSMLSKHSVVHQVLNAKNHEKEAEIVSQAGSFGAVTIATNMAGRGTDIILGGNYKSKIQQLIDPSDKQIEAIKSHWEIENQKVKEAGGLYVIGSERHSSRRIDNQLRGRCARQGDPGESRFYLSVEDSLLRIFANPALRQQVADSLKGGQKYDFFLISQLINNAQKKVEEANFQRRKRELEYDNLINEQRKIFYSNRENILQSTGVKYQELITDICNQAIEAYGEGIAEEDFDILQEQEKIKNVFSINLDLSNIEPKPENVKTMIRSHIEMVRSSASSFYPDGRYYDIEKKMILISLQESWQNHLVNIDWIKQSTVFRGYGQKDPKTEFKRESYLSFVSLMDNLNYLVAKTITRLYVRIIPELEKN